MITPSWPAAAVAIAFLAFVAAIFLTVYFKGGLDDSLKAWAAVGTVVGVVTGAIPSYFFHQNAQVAQRDANALRAAADPQTIERAKSYGLRTS
jgi:hypothetical protein